MVNETQIQLKLLIKDVYQTLQIVSMNMRLKPHSISTLVICSMDTILAFLKNMREMKWNEKICCVHLKLKIHPNSCFNMHSIELAQMYGGINCFVTTVNLYLL